MTRISRKELKKDEFAAEVSKTYEFFQQRRGQSIRYGIVAAVAAAVVLGGLWAYRSRRGHAREDLTHAVRVLYAEPGSRETGMTFPDAKSQQQEAEKELAAVATKYSRLPEGRMARYYLGMAEDKLGKTDAATRDLQAVVNMNDQDVSPLAKYALAGVYLLSGKLSEAEKLYRDLADHPTGSVPRATALLALADAIRPSKAEEARKIYEEVSKDQANPVAAGIATRRLMGLKQ